MEEKRNRINDRKSKFIEKATIKFNGKYDYSLVNYIDAKTRVKIICPIHGEFEQTPDKHLSKKHGCPKCASETRKEIFKKPLEDFICQSKIKFGDKFDYSLVDYKNAHEYVIIVCPIHGKTIQTPARHLNSKYGCQFCGHLETWKHRQRVDNEIFIKRARKIHGDKYDYSLVDCKGAYSNVDIICPKHGKFTQTAKSHYDGNGCPKCKSSKGEAAIRRFLTGKFKFEEQVKFEGLVDKYPLSYDFFLKEENLLIEYNGEHHYLKEAFRKKYKDFLIQKHHDWLKRKYAKEHGFKLLTIPYWQLKIIDSVLENELRKELL